MQKIVVDSSVIVKWINSEDEKYLDEANHILEDAQAQRVAVLAPQLARYEVGNALVKKDLDLPQAYDSLATVYALPIRFVHETKELASETYMLAQSTRKSNQIPTTYYDASFVALAKQEDAILVTDNPKHQQTFKGVKVIALKDYK